MGKLRTFRAGLTALGAVALLTACDDPQQLSTFLQPSVTPKETTVTVVEQQVEAPDVFHTVETGLWDGRPSLGGIWVAHPDTLDPEQVIIRNTDNGKFVIGSLFIRERAVPGPRLQVSSDAAVALGMQAGTPVELNVTALRKREVKLAPATDAPPTVPPVDVAAAADAAIPEPNIVEPTTTATGSTASDVNANDNGGDKATTSAGATMAQSRPATPVVVETASTETPAAPAQASTLEKPYIQLGIFGVEANATNTATAMRLDGIAPTIKQYQAKGKTFWRVLVGPAASVSERTSLLNKVRAKGFTDAYFVSR